MPDWKAIVRSHLVSLRLNGAQEADVIDELAQDLEQRYQDLRASGLPAADALHLAQQILDQTEGIGNELRRRDRSHPLPARPFSGVGQDVRLALRGITSRPVFSFLVIGMLALGIAGNAAIFSIFNGMFLHPSLSVNRPNWSISTRPRRSGTSSTWALPSQIFMRGEKAI